MITLNLDCLHTQTHSVAPSNMYTAYCDACGTVQTILSFTESAEPSPVVNGTPPARSYGCSFGCGNPYDYVFVSVADGTTEFPCMPCFIKLASEILEAVTSPEGSEMMAALAEMRTVEPAPHRNRKQRARGKEAPVNADDPDLIDTFDSRVTSDELPEDFK